jgi:hypothetical protein
VTDPAFNCPVPAIVAVTLAVKRFCIVTALVTANVTPVTVKVEAVAVPKVIDLTVVPVPLKVGILVNATKPICTSSFAPGGVLGVPLTVVQLPAVFQAVLEAPVHLTTPCPKIEELFKISNRNVKTLNFIDSE